MTNYFLAFILVFLIIGFTWVTLMTLGNAIRLRRVKMSWKSGHLLGYPLFSTLFLGLMLSISAVLIWKAPQVNYVVLLAYHWIGLNWFIASFLMSKRYITEHGIVKNVNDPSQTIGWNQIVDYIETPQEKSVKFTFIYQALTDRNKETRRIELDVPQVYAEHFKQMIHNKLGRRFDFPVRYYSDYKSFS